MEQNMWVLPNILYLRHTVNVHWICVPSSIGYLDASHRLHEWLSMRAIPTSWHVQPRLPATKAKPIQMYSIKELDEHVLYLIHIFNAISIIILYFTPVIYLIDSKALVTVNVPVTADSAPKNNLDENDSLIYLLPFLLPDHSHAYTR